MYARKNPELERLRNEVAEPTSPPTVVLNTHYGAKQVHAAFLFQHVGKELLQKLCLILSATASGKSYGDWQSFAAHLSLTTEQIRCIDYDFKGLQDPTYYVLLTFVQLPEATVDKLLDALRKIERLDVLNRIGDSLDDFIRIITQNKFANLKDGLYRPDSLPRAPLVLSPSVKSYGKLNQNVVCGSHEPNANSIGHHHKYGSTVMLTFTKDGMESANEIAAIFRASEPKIGVIILQEQEKLVFSRAEEFVEDCFDQVNYIVPILTEGYLNRVNHVTHHEDQNNSLDSKYVKYIFSLLRYEYVKRDCSNERVRCIVPDVVVNKILAMSVHPTLRAWFKQSDARSIAEKILARKL